jgi:hypothetical protein
MTSWLGERAQVYFNDVIENDVIEARDTRGPAVELRSALQMAESASAVPLHVERRGIGAEPASLNIRATAWH